MELLGKILRTISLAMLFGGSIAVVFSAVVLVQAAKAKGIPVAEAAATNAPIFINYAWMNLGFGFALLLGESLDYAGRRLWTKLTIAQYAASLLCVATTMIFAFGLAQPMSRLMPELSTSETARQEFHTMHNTSRTVFGGTIILALASLLLPIFGALKQKPTQTETEGA